VNPALTAGGRVRPPAGRRGLGRAIAFALAVHLLLFAMLFVGLKWQTRRDEPVQAELWVPPSSAGPKPVAVPPDPAPDPDPEPKPEPKPEPTPAPVPVPIPVPIKPAEINTEQVKRKEAERKQAERAALERLEAARKDAARKEAERKELARKDAERKEVARKEAAQTAQAKKRQDEQTRRDADEKRAEERRRQEAQARRDAQASEARRAEDIRRLQNQAGNAGIPSDTAAKGAAGGQLDAGYAGRLAAAIRSNTTFQTTADLDGNPRAIFLVQLRPDCSLISVKLRKSSGIPAWDQAAERGIERTDPFPRPSGSACQPEIEITRGPRDER
jgi:colicin import membrane protein